MANFDGVTDMAHELIKKVKDTVTSERQHLDVDQQPGYVETTEPPAEDVPVPTAETPLAGQAPPPPPADDTLLE